MAADAPHTASSHAPPNAPQDALWNGPAGRAWVAMQDTLDAMFEPVERWLVDSVAAAGARRVLDVGCGTGRTTRALAARLGPAADCLGVDLSAPMLDAARRRALADGSRARFVQADAQSHDFEGAAFDALASRFGTMFFDDPARAFTNLRHAASDHATLHLVAWRPASENAFMTAAERAAAPLLPDLPRRDPDGPGQFAWGDPSRVRPMLQAAGWTDLDVRPLDADCRFPVSALDAYVAWMGPVGAHLQSADAATRDRVMHAVREAYAPWVQGDTVRFTAACWCVTGRASPRSR